jgi:hypothetical protein
MTAIRFAVARALATVLTLSAAGAALAQNAPSPDDAASEDTGALK